MGTAIVIGFIILVVLVAIGQAMEERKAIAPGGSALIVKQYANAKEYEREAPKMVKAGFTVQGQSGDIGKVAAGRTALKAVTFLPWAVLSPSRKDGKITITWVRNH